MFSGGLVFRRVAKHACTAVLLTRGAPNAMANYAMKLALSVPTGVVVVPLEPSYHW